MNESALSLPFRRNLDVLPVIIPVGLNPQAVPVPAMTGKGVTTFLMHNPNPFWVWFAGWTGAASNMPADLREKAHYIGPGQSYIGRTQMPQWIAAQADDEVGYPVRDPNNGTYLFNGLRTRLVMIYGSGA